MSTLNGFAAISRGLTLGLLQVKIELKQRLNSWLSLGHFFFPLLLLVLFLIFPSFFSDRQEVIRPMLTSAAAVWLSMTGMVSVSTAVIADQDEGIILRAKTLPYGLPGYFVGRVMTLTSISLFGLLMTLIVGEIIVGDILPRSAAQWGLFAILALLAGASTAPLGAIMGSLARGPLASLPISLVAVTLIACSGFFIPIENLPGWVGEIARVFPLYWLGELSRMALGTTPIGGESFHVMAVFLVPALWATIALILVPRAVGVLSRRQSGARMQALQARRAIRGY
jgi:ABC-2 type transport system permease protein